MSGTLQEYKELIVNYLRDMEEANAHGSPDKLRKLDETTDDNLLRKWMWIGALLGGLAFFIVLPLLLKFLLLFIPSILLELVWILVRLGMGLVLIMLCYALYLTFRKQ